MALVILYCLYYCSVVDDEDGLWRRSDTPALADRDNSRRPLKETCSTSIIFNISTLGGFSYCVRSSPVDPGKVYLPYNK